MNMSHANELRQAATAMVAKYMSNDSQQFTAAVAKVNALLTDADRDALKEMILQGPIDQAEAMQRFSPPTCEYLVYAGLAVRVLVGERGIPHFAARDVTALLVDTIDIADAPPSSIH